MIFCTPYYIIGARLQRCNLAPILSLHYLPETSLSRQRKLDTQTEVLRGGGITAAREQRSVGLTVVVEAHGEEPVEGVIGREAQLERLVSAAGTAHHRGYVAHDGSLTAEAEIKTQVEVLVGPRVAVAGGRKG